MGRLFDGTPWDRPPHCERCGLPELECNCPTIVPEAVRLEPGTQTARLRVEKRPKGKMVTVVRGLDPIGNDLGALAARLKGAIGGGGTVKGDGTIEVQGEHLDRVEKLLGSLGYKTRRG